MKAEKPCPVCGMMNCGNYKTFCSDECREKQREKGRKAYQKCKGYVLHHKKEFYKENKKEILDRVKQYQIKPEAKQKRADYYHNVEKYNSNFRMKNKVRSLSKIRVKKGDKCDKCGSKQNLELHHPDYNEPYFVMTLCRTCHCKEHYHG
jgi:hypothetical protein